MTLREALIQAIERLDQNPDLAATASRDAELLLLHTLALPRTALYTDPARPLTSVEQTAFHKAITRRLAHEPIQYITGMQEFFGLPLRVTPATLIPRPETELLVEAVLHHVNQIHLPHDRRFRLADVGTGSGAIAIALATHLLQAEVLALDISSAALEVARENARAYRVADRVHVEESNLLPSAAGPFDAVIANLPYIPDADRATLHPQVREHEPNTALFAGPDGLDLVRRLIPQAARALVPGGLLALEFGFGQRDALTHLLTSWRDLRFLDDLQGTPRVALALAPA